MHLDSISYALFQSSFGYLIGIQTLTHEWMRLGTLWLILEIIPVKIFRQDPCHDAGVRIYSYGQ